MLLFRKAISPVVATALLLVVAVISIVSFSSWFTEFSSLVFIDVESQSSNSAGLVEIDNLIGETLYVVNNNVNSVNVSKFSVGGVDCDLGELESGMNEIDISHCVEKISVGKVDLLLVADTSVVEKQIYLDEEFSSSVYFGPSDVFVSVWDTRLNSSGSSNKTQINLPLIGINADYNFNISWGDGTTETISTNVALHNYAEPGIYQIEIDGLIKGFRFANNGDKLKLLDIKQWGNLNVGDGGRHFYGCTNFVGTFRDTLNLTGVTDLHFMFHSASFFNGDISNWDVSSVTDMGMMFRYTDAFNQDLSSWNVSSVTDMNYMFNNAAVFNQDLSAWDVSSVIDIGNMFGYAAVFNQDLSAWDVSSVTDMSHMFFYADVFNQDLSTWNVSSVTDIAAMFFYATSFNGDLSNWDVSSVTDMSGMFRGNTVFNQDISGWNVSSVTNMDYMFNYATIFNQDLSSWNVSKVDTCTGFILQADNWSLPKPNFTNCTY